METNFPIRKFEADHAPPTCPDCGYILRIGDYPFGCKGGHNHKSNIYTRLQAIHSSEVPVIYRNQRTGEVRYPARSDQPIPAVYAAQGYERVTLNTPQAIASHERATGRIHEARHYDNGSATAERDMGTHIRQAEVEAPKMSVLDGGYVSVG